MSLVEIVEVDDGSTEPSHVSGEWYPMMTGLHRCHSLFVCDPMSIPVVVEMVVGKKLGLLVSSQPGRRTALVARSLTNLRSDSEISIPHQICNRPSGMADNSGSEVEAVALSESGRLMMTGAPRIPDGPIRCWIFFIALLNPAGSLIWSMNL